MVAFSPQQIPCSHHLGTRGRLVGKPGPRRGGHRDTWASSDTEGFSIRQPQSSAIYPGSIFTGSFNGDQFFKPMVWTWKKGSQRLKCSCGSTCGCLHVFNSTTFAKLWMHSDVMDAFMVQLGGSKSWKVCDVTSWMAPRERYDQLPLKLNGTCEEVLMQQGDVMYLPYGTLHQASTSSDYSMHLTVNIERQYYVWLALIFAMIHKVAKPDLTIEASLPATSLPWWWRERPLPADAHGVLIAPTDASPAWRRPSGKVLQVAADSIVQRGSTSWVSSQREIAIEGVADIFADDSAWAWANGGVVGWSQDADVEAGETASEEVRGLTSLGSPTGTCPFHQTCWAATAETSPVWVLIFRQESCIMSFLHVQNWTISLQRSQGKRHLCADPLCAPCCWMMWSQPGWLWTTRWGLAKIVQPPRDELNFQTWLTFCGPIGAKFGFV